MTPLEKTLAIVEAALDKQAYDLIVLQAEHLSSIADYFVIATGRSDVQVQSICRGVEERMDREGARPLSIEGFNLGYWVALDYNDVVVHIFYEPIRDLYRLEMENFSNPWTVAFYVLSMLVVGSHLWHGASSAFQSLGVGGRSAPRLLIAGRLVAVLIAGAFIAIAVWACLTGARA